MIDSQNSRPKISLGIIAIMLITVIFGTVGGGMLGGIAGYLIALNQSPALTTIPQPSTVSFSATDQLPTMPTLSPTESNNAVVTENGSLIEAIDKVKPATVTVLNFVGSGRSGSGSGVIIDESGYIITNHHVIQGTRRLEVILSHGGRVSAQLVGSSPAFDLAVLKINRRDVPAVAGFGDSAALRQGERVAAIGSALGDFRNTVTSGVLSAHNRDLGNQSGLLQTDTPINHGNSGGPLINLNGEVIGINVMVLRGSARGDVAEGLGFSIPSNTARMVAKQLIETGRVEVPFLGVQPRTLNPQLSLENGLTVVTGSYIEAVVPNTAAAQSGIKQGDVILAVNGQAVDDAHPLRQLLLQHNVGDDIDLTIIRGADQFSLTVTLGKQ